MSSDQDPNQPPAPKQGPIDYKAKAEEFRRKAQATEQGILPGVPVTPKGTAPMGNELARTPLFAPIQRGRRKIIDMARLSSPESVALWYFGKQLDMGDQDTYLAALYLAKGVEPDAPIKVNRAELLRMMGKKTDGRTYKWLDDSFTRISTGRLFYDTPEKKGSTPLLGPLEYDKETEEYYFTVPETSLRAFGIRAYGYVDMEKRRMIGSKADLAKWLQCYAASHAKGEHKVSVANLKTWSGFEGRLRQFRGNLETALAELVRVGVLESWELYEGNKKVKWIR
jgi:hypothetical protein